MDFSFLCLIDLFFSRTQEKQNEQDMSQTSEAKSHETQGRETK